MAEPDKATLREQALLHRKRICAYGNEDSEGACVLFFDAVQPVPGQIVASYWPVGTEFDPGCILERLLNEGFSCALPVVRKGRKILDFALWSEGDPLVEAAHGIMQPLHCGEERLVVPDILLVPFLAFDRRGYRLGYGGGYYDATLRALREEKPVVAVGAGFAQQAVLFNLPVEDHDEKLDWVVTPLQAHYFGGPER